MTTNRHPDAETLAAFAEGRIDRARQAELLAHIEACDVCLEDVQLANETFHAESSATSPRIWWMAAAAAVVIGIVTLALLRPWRTPIDKLVDASPRSVRVVEPRLAGGFAWAPYRGPVRAADAARDPQRLRLDGAAADIIENGGRDASANAQRAAGVALILTDAPNDAIARLRAAAERAPRDAKSRSDLAAAEYAAAVRDGTPSRYPEALGDCDRALRLEPRMPEALFNRALVLERLGLFDAARTAWQAYLAVDASSPWANEARAHLRTLPATNGAQSFERDRPLLERAAVAGDVASVVAIVDRHRERARAYGEAEYLGRWADAVQRHDAVEAQRCLATARAIGDALARLSGESLLHDAVHAIDVSGAELAGAHVAYRRGRIAYANGKPGDAEADLLRAAQLFAEHDDPMALVARWYAANTRYDRRDVERARDEIEAVLAQRRPSHRALDAGLHWELALCRQADGDLRGALDALAIADADYLRNGERGNRAAIANLRAIELDVLGRPDDAWRARIDALAEASRQEDRDRLARDLETASAALVRSDERDAARAILRIEESVAREGSSGLLVHALAREAQLDLRLNDAGAAAAAANEARDVAGRLADPFLRARELAVADVAFGAVALEHDPRQADAVLSIAGVRLADAGLWPNLADAELLRATAAAALGNRDEESRRLDSGIAALARYLVPLGGTEAPGVFETEAQLLARAVRLHVARNEVGRAFAYVERSRGSAGVALRDVQQRLAGSGTVILESFVAGSDVFTFAIDEQRAIVTTHPLRRGSDAELYESLIRPSQSLLATARRVIIVPDPVLANVPYAALTDGARPLVAMMPVAIAPSAGALVREPRRRPASVMAMALPHGDGVALPETEQEIADVARIYPRGATQSEASFAAMRDASADVVHIAGHASRGAGSDDAVMRFASNERVSWRRIAAIHFANAPIVTLAACESLRTDSRAGVRSLSLGGGFLAAGARDVIGTLVPITDRDAHAIFCRIHRRLAAGVAADEAVREAQLENKAAGDTTWRAVAILTSRISE